MCVCDVVRPVDSTTPNQSQGDDSHTCNGKENGATDLIHERDIITTTVKVSFEAATVRPRIPSICALASMA